MEEIEKEDEYPGRKTCVVEGEEEEEEEEEGERMNDSTRMWQTAIMKHPYHR